MAMISKVIGAGMTALYAKSTIDEYKESREQGDNILVSAGKAGLTLAANELLGGWMIPVQLAQTGIGLADAAWSHTKDVMHDSFYRRGKIGSGHFDMTEAGYTMRQRSLNAIRSNGLVTQSALGGEARTYYRGAGY